MRQDCSTRVSKSGGVSSNKFLFWLQLFVAVSAFGGGLVLIADPSGGLMQMPLSILADTPFSSFFAPGVILFAAVGGSAFSAAIALARKARHAFLLSAAAGAIVFGWIVIQVYMIHGIHLLHFIYGGAGLVEMALSLYIYNAMKSAALGA